jgi:hypothetical protein
LRASAGPAGSTWLAQAEAAAAADLPQFMKEEFNAFVECGIVAHGFLRQATRWKAGEFTEI